jgi:hypothetical protein
VFGNKSLLKRVTKAVEPTLEPGETLVVPVYVRDLHFSLETILLGLPASGSVDTWIVSLTDRRVIVHKGDNFNAARSKFLGASPRERVRVVAAEPPDKPAHVTLSFDGDEGHRFEVPLVWRKAAREFVEALAATPQ